MSLQQDKRVSIVQVNSFTLIPVELRNEFTKNIGSKFDKDVKDVMIGLDHKERRYILPEVISNLKGENDPDWREKVRNFYAELTIVVPVGKKGLSLNIATFPKKITLDGELVTVNFPHSPMDYLIYKQCVKDATVAVLEHEIQNPAMFDFILVDDTKAKEKSISIQENLDKMDSLYLELVKKEEDGSLKNSLKIDAVLRMLGKNPEIYEDPMKIQTLSESRNSSKKDVSNGVDLKDTEFYSIVSDPKLGIKSLIMKLVERGILQQEGSSYRDPENDLILGNSISEAVNFIDNPVNSKTLTNWKFKLNGKVK